MLFLLFILPLFKLYISYHIFIFGLNSLLVINLISFVSLKKTLLSFLKGTFSRIGILNWQFCLFLCFKDAPVYSGLHCSWREVFCYSYLHSFVCNVSFFLLAAFMIFSLPLFLAFWLWYTLAYFSLCFLHFGFIKLLESVGLLWYHIWEKC